MICEPWTIVVVPFPFSERPGSKRRPALVLSGRTFNAGGHTVCSALRATPAFRSAGPYHAGLEDAETTKEEIPVQAVDSQDVESLGVSFGILLVV